MARDFRGPEISWEMSVQKKKSIMKLAIILTLGVVAFTASTNAQTTIDTTPGWNGVNYIDAWGPQNTATYGQTFTATAAQNNLLSMSFYIDAVESSAYNFQAYVYEWTGSDTTGGALFTSGTMAAPTTVGSFVNTTVNTGGLSLTPGQQYVAFYSVNGLGNGGSGEAFWGYLGTSQQNGSDSYAGGNFVFNNNTDTTFEGGWENPTYYAGQAGDDLAFTLTFASVPEPTTLALLGLSGLVVFLRRRK
jgi:hypothetical protein